MKKFMAMILTVSTLLCGVNGLSVLASETLGGTPITTVEEFLSMQDSGVYYLATDIDFSGKTYT